MIIERTLKDKTTVAEIFACIPPAIEMPEAAFTPVAGASKQCFTIDREWFAKFPVYDWMQIFRLVTGEDAPSAAEMKEQVRAANRVEKAATAAQVVPWV